MINPIYVTGNKKKAKYFSRMVGLEFENQSIDVDEIQSLDIREVVTHKARAAYEIIKAPVVVEDTYLQFTALHGLPGTYIKWFLETVGNEGLCRLVDSYDDRSATAGACIAYYDGDEIHVFESSLNGSIAKEPKAGLEFGWNPIFIPNGETRTLGEMSEKEFETFYQQVKPFAKFKEFVQSLN